MSTEKQIAELMCLADRYATDRTYMTREALRDHARKMVEALRNSESSLLDALQFYADKDHFMIADEDAWDTVSGEPQNYWCDAEGTATIEDGSNARAAIKTAPQKGQVMDSLSWSVISFVAGYFAYPIASVIRKIINNAIAASTPPKE